MPAKQLRCEVSVIPENDATVENAVECGAIALACTDCGDSARCEEHAVVCAKCGNAVCDFCAEEHSCIAASENVAA